MPSEQTRVLVVRDAFDNPWSDRGADHASNLRKCAALTSVDPRFQFWEPVSRAGRSVARASPAVAGGRFVVPGEQTRVLVVRDAFDTPGSDRGADHRAAASNPRECAALTSVDPRFQFWSRYPGPAGRLPVPAQR